MAQQVIIANAVTRGFAGTNLIPFLTEGWLMPKTSGSVYGAGNSWTFSAAELAQGLAGGGFGQSGQGGYTNDLDGVTKAVKKNLAANGGAMIASLVLVPIAFNVGMKLLRKPIILPANRMLKAAGIREVKV